MKPTNADLRRALKFANETIEQLRRDQNCLIETNAYLCKLVAKLDADHTSPERVPPMAAASKLKLEKGSSGQI